MKSTYALILDDQVWQIFSEDPRLGESANVREVSGVSGIAPGWRVTDDGGFAPPETFTPTPPPVPDRCSKLGLKRALSETGKDAALKRPDWDAVKALIADDPDLREDWDLAVEVRAADPLVQAMIVARKYDDATVSKILIRANALVA